MGKKRSYRSDSEASDGDEDHAMNAADDNNDGDNDETMKDDQGPKSPSLSATKKKDMKLRSGRRKRRRSVGTTGLTPPPTSKRASKKARITTVDESSNGDQKPPAAEDPSALQVDSKVDSPLAVDPRRISYSRANAFSPEQSESSSEDEEESDEIDVAPPPQIAQVNGKSQEDSEAAVVEPLAPENDDPKEMDANENEVIETKEQDVSENTIDYLTEKPVGVSTLKRLVIFAILGYLSLLLTMPQVVKFSQDMVPIDDSILPPLPKMNTTLPEEDSEIDPAEALETWNKDFLASLGKLKLAKEGYSESKESLGKQYDELLNRVNQIVAQLEPRQKEMESRLTNLNRLEELLQGLGTNKEIEKEAGLLAQQLLGETIVTTSSIELWNIQDDVDANCDLGLDEDDAGADSAENIDTDTEPLLLASVLEEKISSLILRSTITAEKFIGGAVAEDRIRTWVKSRIEEMIEDEEDVLDAIEEIEEFPQLISESNTNTEQSDFELTQIIQDRLEIHRADITGTYDYASLKNGAEVIYGGKRGTSKSLVDELPVLNRILQNSKLRFYGFGPQAALTATYPPNSLGQCWSFRQTSLKEQLKERKLFENDKKVKNDFKRGNFGTLTIRLSEPIVVQSIVIEHAPGQTSSAIRKFRMVGYEDELATSKAWNLGSFEYSLKDNRENNKYLQTFEAATTVFGKEIPPLHSISLAVDSNHGHDYSCLYRFRIHGK